MLGQYIKLNGVKAVITGENQNGSFTAETGTEIFKEVTQAEFELCDYKQPQILTLDANSEEIVAYNFYKEQLEILKIDGEIQYDPLNLEYYVLVKDVGNCGTGVTWNPVLQRWETEF